MSNERRTIVFLSHADEGSLRTAGSCALVAAAMEERVDVFLVGASVTAVMEAADEGEGGAAWGLLRARREGRCRIFACSASVLESGLDPSELEPFVDAVVGWPTILEWTRGVPDRFFF